MQGFGVAASFSILPVFIGEVSESHNRGALSCMQGVFIALGLLFSYIAGPYLSVQVSKIKRQVEIVILCVAYSVDISALYKTTSCKLNSGNPLFYYQ